MCFLPSDLAGLIKDKNRNIEKLEEALEKQSLESDRQIQELNEQLSSWRTRKKDGSIRDKKDGVGIACVLVVVMYELKPEC